MKYIMKKNLLVFSLIFAMFSAFAQEVKTENNNDNATDYESVETPSFCPHRINIDFGEAFTNNIYKRVGMTQYYSLSSMLDVNYAYFFNEHWGLSIGVGVNRIDAKTSISTNGIIPKFPDNVFAPNVSYATEYDLYYDAHGLNEKQVVWAIEVPLKAQFEWKFGNGRNGIYAGLGLVGYFPISAYNKYSNEGKFTTYGYEELYNQYYNRDVSMVNHFPELNYTGKGDNVKLRCSFGLDADFGGVFAMGPKADFYLGAYVKYNFLDILPSDSKKVPMIVHPEQEGQINMQFSGTLASDMLHVMKENTEKYKDISTKWHPLQVGVKIGVHLKTCANPAEKTRKQIEKEILEELKKRANEPIIVKQDPQYIYIVPVCDQLDEDESGLTAEDRENIRQLAIALSNIKILFDLDKDIPKIAESNDKINETVKLLGRDPSLKLVVEGYTCDLGTETHNRDLAQRRANKVRELFIQRGVNSNQIETASYTANDPQNKQNIQDSRREEHRAVIFRIIKR